MAETPIAPDLHQALDVEVDFSPQVSFDNEVPVDVIAQAGNLVLRQLPHSRRRVYANGRHSFAALGSPDPVDIRQCNFHTLIVGYVDPCDSCQRDPPAPFPLHHGKEEPTLALSLPLLVARVLADHPDDAMTSNDLALLTARLD